MSFHVISVTKGTHIPGTTPIRTLSPFCVEYRHRRTVWTYAFRIRMVDGRHVPGRPGVVVGVCDGAPLIVGRRTIHTITPYDAVLAFGRFGIIKQYWVL